MQVVGKLAEGCSPCSFVSSVEVHWFAAAPSLAQDPGGEVGRVDSARVGSAVLLRGVRPLGCSWECVPPGGPAEVAEHPVRRPGVSAPQAVEVPCARLAHPPARSFEGEEAVVCPGAVHPSRFRIREND